MQTAARLIMSFVGFVVVVAACGGSSGSDVNAPLADAGGASSGTSGLGSSSGASSGGTSSGGTSGSVLTDGGASSSSSGNVDGGGDAGTKVGNTTTQTCGGTACSIADNTCCVTGGTAKCVPKATGCTTGGGGGGDTAALRCSGQANCTTGTVCCIHDAANGTASECKPKCAPNEAQLCDPTASVSGCPTDVKCSSDNIKDWNLPNTFATCGGVPN